MPDEEDAAYDEWRQQIADELTKIGGPVALIGHSLGASILAKYLSEAEVRPTVTGVFLLTSPFWGGDGWRYEGWEELALPEDFAVAFPQDPFVFLYHCRDGEIVPFEHLELYRVSCPVQQCERSMPAVTNWALICP